MTGYYRERSTLNFEAASENPARISFFQDDVPRTVKGSRIITIPVASTWNVGLHWHEDYTESVKVLKGKARITLAGVTRVYGPEDGIVTFPKFAIHGFGRADGGKEGAEDAEDTVIEEWVDPEDGFKAVFFYNVLGALQACGGKPGLRDILQIGTMIAYVDEYPDVVPGPFWFKKLVVHAGETVVAVVGWLLGFEAWKTDYTPEHLWDVARTRGSAGQGGDKRK